MNRLLRSICILLLPFISVAQRIDVDVFGGMSNYQGDLQNKFFSLSGASPGAAVILKYGITNNIYIRGGFSFGSMSGDDAKQKERVLLRRNLNFRSKLQEFSLGVEYRLLSPETFAITPYFFAGAGVFRFDPYTYSGDGSRLYLRPLSTEGQGLAEYPDRKPYNLTQICIPYGVGIKWQINCNLNIGAEFRHTKTFTDYLDDVSNTYVNQAALLAARGQTAVDYAWRRDEIDGSPYPSTDQGRGNPGQKDWYYFAGVTVGLKINDCETGNFSLGGIFKKLGNGGGLFRRSSGGGNFGSGGRRAARKQVGCPSF